MKQILIVGCIGIIVIFLACQAKTESIVEPVQNAPNGSVKVEVSERLTPSIEEPRIQDEPSNIVQDDGEVSARLLAEDVIWGEPAEDVIRDEPAEDVIRDEPEALRLNIDKLTLYVSMSLGPALSFTLTVFKDRTTTKDVHGAGRLPKNFDRKTLGMYQGLLSHSDFAQLMQAVERADILKLEERYFSGITDVRKYELSVDYADGTKKIINTDARGVDVPEDLVKLIVWLRDYGDNGVWEKANDNAP
ncbi:MAG: hypothetical protein WC966_12095 [Bradymonadales bacterium]|jgi:hypothetical protein